MPDRNGNLEQEMERDSEIRRKTSVRDALGPVEDTDAERNAADSALSDRERQGRVSHDDRAGQPAVPSRDDRDAAAHGERGVRSDVMMDTDMDTDDVRNAEDRE
jgi:hypothetical protein